MKCTLDFPFIRDILKQEHARARDEIPDVRVLRALESSQQRRDARIAAAPDIDTLACRAGCTACCYFTVGVRAAEVFRILDYVEQSFTLDEKARVYAVVRANSVAIRKLGDLKSYEEPENLDIDPDFAPGVYQAGGAHVEAVSRAMCDAGYDVNAYELNCGLDAALSEPGARGRFESRLKPFTGPSGEEVPAEFDDLGPRRPDRA